MPSSHPVVALVAVSAGLLAPAGQRTHPAIHPRVGASHTTFALSFTLRSAPGHSGVLATAYRVSIAPDRPLRAACAPPQPASVQSGSPGQVEHLMLTGPPSGWCRGRYSVTVYLERGPYCPPPVSGGMPAPCPEFATQELDTGSTSFQVR